MTSEPPVSWRRLGPHPRASTSARARAGLLAVPLSLLLLTGACSSGPGERTDGQPVDGASAGASKSAKPKPPTAGELAVRRMTLREKAGQVIVASWRGTASPAPMVRRLHLGGVIALGDNIVSPDQIRQVNGSLRRAVAGRGYPAFVGVDQEGGIVDRVGGPVTTFPAFMATGAAGETDLTRTAARASAAELRGLGFDVVFAPVADVTIGSGDAVIGSRSAGDRPRQVARQVVAAVAGVEEAGVLPVVKHFPGHGSLSVDTHRAVAVQDRPLPQLRRTDLVPFAAAIAARVPAVMTGHIVLEQVDAKDPASISKPVTTGLLRQQMGFRGLVVTDALNMQGVQRKAPGGRAAVRALRAGADVLLMPPDPRQARDAIVAAVHERRLPLSRLDAAAARMVDTLLAVRKAAASAQTAGVGSGRDTALALARRSLTSVAGPCEGRLLSDAVRLVGPPQDVDAVETALEARSVEVRHDYTKRVRAGSKRVQVGERVKKVVTKVRKVPIGKVGKKGKPRFVEKIVKVTVPIYRRRPIFKSVYVKADAPTLALVGQDSSSPGPVDILVALDRPTVLGRASARVELATYGDEPVSIQALTEVLLGDRGAPGHLPVSVPGAERAGC